MIRRIQYSNYFIFLVKLDLLSSCRDEILCPVILFASKPILSDSDRSTLTFLLNIFLVMSYFVVSLLAFLYSYVLDRSLTNNL